MTCSHNDELCAAHLGLAGASVGLPVATAAAPSLLAGCWPQRLVCKSSRRPSQVLDPNPVSCSQAEQTPDAVRDKVTAAKLKCAGALAALDAKKYKAAAKKFSEARAPRAAPRNALRVCSGGLPSRPRRASVGMRRMPPAWGGCSPSLQQVPANRTHRVELFTARTSTSADARMQRPASAAARLKRAALAALLAQRCKCLRRSAPPLQAAALSIS